MEPEEESFPTEMYEQFSPNSFNKEDRVERINPNMYCSICPPNRGENAVWMKDRLWKSEKNKNRRAKQKKQGRNFKEKNKEDI